MNVWVKAYCATLSSGDEYSDPELAAKLALKKYQQVKLGLLQSEKDLEDKHERKGLD